MKANIPLNSKRYQSKVGGFSPIEMVFIVLGLIAMVGYGVLFIVLLKVDFKISLVLAIILGTPIIICGFINQTGLNAVEVFKRTWNEIVFHDNYRPYKIERFTDDEKK